MNELIGDVGDPPFRIGGNVTVGVATKSVFPGAIVGRSFILSILFLILVVALFFIPEIIHLQESLFKTVGSSAQSASSYRVEEQGADAEKAGDSGKHQQLSALDKVLVMLNSGYLESTNKAGATPPDVKNGSRARLSLSSLLPGQEQNPPEVSPQEGQGLSWRTLRTPQVSKVLRKARDDVRALAKGLGPNCYQSRDALLNYQNGINWLLEGDRSPLPIQSGLDYIERLDLDATRALIRDRVDRADYIQWSKISLGPLLANSQAARLKQEYLAPYNPRITLANIKLTVGKVRVSKDGIVAPPQTHATVIGFVLGKDTKRLVLYRDGKRVRNIPLPKKTDAEGKRVFRFTVSPAIGAISIQGVDGMNYLVQKNYRFFPKAAAFNRLNRVVQLPFAPVDTRNFEIREVDLRMDRFFRESVSSSSPNEGKQTSEKYQLMGF